MRNETKRGLIGDGSRTTVAPAGQAARQGGARSARGLLLRRSGGPRSAVGLSRGASTDTWSSTDARTRRRCEITTHQVEAACFVESRTKVGAARSTARVAWSRRMRAASAASSSSSWPGRASSLPGELGDVDDSSAARAIASAVPDRLHDEERYLSRARRRVSRSRSAASGGRRRAVLSLLASAKRPVRLARM